MQCAKTLSSMWKPVSVKLRCGILFVTIGDAFHHHLNKRVVTITMALVPYDPEFAEQQTVNAPEVPLVLPSDFWATGYEPFWATGYEPLGFWLMWPIEVKEITDLPFRKWQWDMKRIKPKDEEVCAVCFEKDRKVRRRFGKHCSHTFHEKCIRGLYNRGLSCPLCRTYPSNMIIHIDFRGGDFTIDEVV